MNFSGDSGEKSLGPCRVLEFFFFSLVTASFPASVLISQIYKEGKHIPPPLNIEGPKEKVFSPNLTHNGTRYILAN